MVRPQFKLVHLLVLILFAGSGIAGLTSPTPLGASLIYTATWTLLLASIPCALFHRGTKRYFCVGFAVFGLAHQLKAYGDLGNPTDPPIMLSSMLWIVARELTKSGFHKFTELCYRVNITPTSEADSDVLSWAIWYSLLSLIIAYLAGLLTRYFFVRRDDRRSQSEEGT